MIERIIAVIGLFVILLFMIVGWIVYGSPLGFIPLLLCDILGIQTLC